MASIPGSFGTRLSSEGRIKANNNAVHDFAC